MKIKFTPREIVAYWRHSIKFFLLLFAVSFLFFGNSYAGWVAKTSGTTYTLNGVYALNKDTVIVVGDMGKILRTLNGGQTAFDTVSSGTNQKLNDVVFTSLTTGFVARDSGVVKTTNSGGAWTSTLNSTTVKQIAISYDKSATSNVFSYTDANLGMCGSTFYKSTDAGGTWTSTSPVITALCDIPRDFHMVSTATMFVVGPIGKIVKSTDGGSTWSGLTSGTTANLNGIYFINANTGFAVGDTGKIIKTTNGGTSWTAQTSGTTSILYDVHFLDSLNGIAVGATGTILRTTNSGATWSGESSGTSYNLNSVYMVSAEVAYVVGGYGTILKRYGPVTVTSTQVNVACNSQCNGSADITPGGGQLPYTYKWTNGATTQDLASLCAGTYTATVRDNSSPQQVKTHTIIITQPASLTASVVGVNLLCNALCNGSVSTTPSGGTTPYTYKWSSGQTTQNISSLCAGTYTVTLKDANLCKTNTSKTITEPSVLSVTLSAIHLTCNGVCNGGAISSVTGGTASYSYKWSNGSTLQNLSGGLCAGTYTLTVTDANNCKANSSVTLTQPTALTVSTTGTNITCNGLCNGSANSTPAGGTSPYTYKWSTGLTTQSITSLCAGTYTISITDNNSCKTNAPVTITQPTSLTVTVSGVNLSCNSVCTGSASSTPSGGTTPYTYKWSNGSTTQNLSNLCAGTYTVTAIDANNCKAYTPVTITQPTTALTVTTTGTNLLCNAVCNGGGTSTPSGGTTPYTYKWSNGATTQNILSICAGTYTVTVKDANLCKTNASVTITQPTALSVSIAGINALCNGVCTGSANSSPAGGTTPYTYKWSNGVTTQNLSSLCVGTYTITLTDINVCKVNSSVNITQPAALTVSLTGVNTTCSGICDGSATATPSGGTTPYTYKWTNGVTTATANNLCSGTYTATVTDANICKTNGSKVITSPVTLGVSATATNVNCNGGADGTANSTPGGGTTPYTYKWNTGQTTQNLTGLVAGTYIVTAKDANACKANTSVTITQPTVALTIKSGTTNSSCGSANGSASATGAGGTSPYTYKWNNGVTTQTISGMAAGSYTVTVKDNNLCKNNKTVTINNNTGPAVTASSVNVKCKGGNDGSASSTPTGGATPYTYKWSNGATTQNISVLTVGTYTITVKDANNCKANATVSVLEPAALLAVTLTGVNTTCSGICDGSATATPSGGTTPYTYKWTNGVTTSTAGSLCSGTYTATVTDANICKTNGSKVITSPVTLGVSATATNVNCNGGVDGTASSSPGGGTTPYTYKWNTGQTIQNLTGLAAGTYIVTVKDVNACKANTSVTITQPTALIIKSGTTNSSCGSANGSASATGAGGTSPYTYKWNNGVTTQTISGMAAGSYTVTVKDNNLCKNNKTVTINNNTGPAVTASSVNVKCKGGNDGSASSTPTGGATPYSYKWSNGATTQNITGLIVGTYTITVKDANNCIANATVSVLEPAAVLSVTLAGVNTTCSGICDGSATATPSGGTTPYTYKWTNGITTSAAGSLCSGTYTVTITDVNACKTNGSKTITSPTTLGVTVTSTNVNCNGAADGTANVVATSGGTSPYTYKWNNGQTTQSVTGLTAGTYIVSAKDANACKANASVTITQPAIALTIKSGTTNSTCGSANGSASATGSGGTSPYNYKWNNGATTQTITGLAAGSYTSTVTDANGCKSGKSLAISNANGPSVTSSVTHINCNGFCNGMVNITVTGGTTPYSYKWSNGSSTEDISFICAGSYTVTTTDANGCKTPISTIVTQPSAVSVTVVGNNAICSGACDGSATATPSGGTSPYTYKWTNGATASTAGSLCSGTYNVTVADANGCKATGSATITAPAGLTVSTASVDAKCNGATDGSASCTPAGGTSPYTFKWSSGQTVQSLTGLASGFYIVTVIDANGCKTNGSVTVNEPSTFVIASISKTDATCGNSDGSASAVATGGTPGYSYKWSNGSSTSSISGLSANVYSVTATDINNCKAFSSISVNDLGGPTATIYSSINVSCNGGNNGSASVTVSGGASPFIYKWSNGATINFASGLTAGNYAITVTDANNCKSVTSINIIEPTILIASVSGTDESCASSCNGVANLTASGGTTPYTYKWNNGSTVEDAVNLCGGSYAVTIIDNNGCISNANVVINSASALVVSVSGNDAKCFGSNDGNATASVSGGITPYSYNWSNGATNASISGLVAGNYSVNVFDANGCLETNSITLNQPTELLVTVTSTDANCGNADGSAKASASGGLGAYNYQWSTGAVTQSVSNLISGAYTVSVTDVNGCLNKASFNIVDAGAPLAIINYQKNVSCNGTSDGEASVSVSGGTAPYSYNWSNGNTLQFINGLMAGSYVVTVTDFNGCVTTASVSILEPTVVLVTATSVSSTCGNPDGSATANVSGGTTPYSYTWSNGATISTITGAPAGIYTVNVFDLNGCYATVSVNVNDIGGPTAFAKGKNVSCNSTNDGSAKVSVTGGTSPYVFKWNNGATTTIIFNLTAGNYAVTVTDANGCRAGAVAVVNEPDSIVSAFSYLDDTSNINTVQFTNTSFGAITNFLWDFGDGTKSKLSDPNHQYSYPGYFLVCLTAFDSVNGCVDRNCMNVKVAEDTLACYVYADFSYIQDTAMLINFTNTSLNVTRAYWNFGDGKSSNQIHPSHNYPMPGFYKVCLTVFNDSTSCQDHICHTVNVIDSSVTIVDCNAEFTFYPDELNLIAYFTNLSQGDISSYYWYFGDGYTSTIKNPNHKYNTPGYYNVCLTTFDTITGCQDYICHVVDVIDTTLLHCNAEFTNFVDSTTHIAYFRDQSNGKITNWYWEFGDGYTSTMQHPEHSYSGPGYFNVCLVVFDSVYKCMDYFCDVVVIEFDSVYYDCNAQFTYFPGSNNQTVNFNNSSTGSYSILFWDFGDGSISFDMNPIHSYSGAGFYDVCLTVYDTLSQCMDVYCTSVQIGGDTASVADCEALFSSFPIGTSSVVHFKNESNGAITNYLWEFSNGAVSNKQNPLFDFGSSGYYDVCLTVFDSSDGCMNQTCKQIQVGGDSAIVNDCKGLFSYTVLKNFNVKFKDVSKGQFTSWYWNFDDGTVSNARNPMHQYSSSGFYDVCLTVFNQPDSCIDNICLTVQLIDSNSVDCKAKFTYYADSGSTIMHFRDGSFGNPTSWYWDFGDGSTAGRTQNPDYTYAQAGIYEVCLTITNDLGCQKTICKVIQVGDGGDDCYSKFDYFADSVTSTAHFSNKSLGKLTSYFWEFGDGVTSTQQIPVHTYAGIGVYVVCLTVNNAVGCVSTYCDYVNIGSELANKCEFSCVWPGDANNDLEANHYDLLAIGLNFSETGPKRDSTSTRWIGHYATDWSSYQISGVNNKHGDCNGDGVINFNDTLAIEQNFAFSHPKQYNKTRNSSNPDLYFEILSDNDIAPGSSVEVAIMASQDSSDVIIYGIGFEVKLTADKITAGSLNMDYSNSWLGVKNSDMLAFKDMNYPQGELSVGMVRNDQADQTGKGELARFTFTVDANANLEEGLGITVTTQYGMDSQGDTVTFNSGTTDTLKSSIYDLNSHKIYNISLYPNPATDNVSFELPDIAGNSEYYFEIINTIGQVVYTEEFKNGGLKSIDLNQFSEGMYFVQISSVKVSYQQKLQITR